MLIFNGLPRLEYGEARWPFLTADRKKQIGPFFNWNLEDFCVVFSCYPCKIMRGSGKFPFKNCEDFRKNGRKNFEEMFFACDDGEIAAVGLV